MLFLRNAQLILQSSILTVLDLDEVNVTLDIAEIFGSALPGEGGYVGGGWPQSLVLENSDLCYIRSFALHANLV
jgi:hypothetical protein